MKNRVFFATLALAMFFAWNLSKPEARAHQDWDLIESDHLWNLKSVEELQRHFKEFSVSRYGLAKYNFGAVINNQRHRLYRSKALGELGARELFAFLKKNGLPIPNLVVYMDKRGFRQPNSLHGGLYGIGVSRRLPEDAFAFEECQLFSAYGPFPGVSFFHPLNSQVYLTDGDMQLDKQVFTTDSFVDQDIKSSPFLRSQIRAANTGDYIIGGKENLYFILKLILESRDPVLFHSTHGRHRAGMVALALRYLQDLEANYWTKPFANPIPVKAETSRGRVGLKNLAEVEYYLHNMQSVRASNLRSIRRLSREKEFKTLAKKYGSSLNGKSS